MIYNNQLEKLSEEERLYLFYCCHEEWSKVSSIDFNINYVNAFKQEAVIFILNNYKLNLKQDHQDLPNIIIQKMFLTY